LYEWLGYQLYDRSQLYDTFQGVGHLIAFAAGALFWAWQTFYWARFASRLPARFRQKPIYSPPILSHDRIEALNERMRRRLGRLVLISVWAALVLANLESGTWRMAYDVFYAASSAILIAGLFAARRWLVRFVPLAGWAALVVWVVANDGTSLCPLYQLLL